MAHLSKDNKKLLHRIGRIQGQLNTIREMLSEAHDSDCGEILQLIAACRGAMNGLMREVIEEHIYNHVVEPNSILSSNQEKALRQLLDVVKTYLK